MSKLPNHDASINDGTIGSLLQQYLEATASDDTSAFPAVAVQLNSNLRHFLAESATTLQLPIPLTSDAVLAFSPKDHRRWIRAIQFAYEAASYTVAAVFAAFYPNRKIEFPTLFSPVNRTKLLGLPDSFLHTRLVAFKTAMNHLAGLMTVTVSPTGPSVGERGMDPGELVRRLMNGDKFRHFLNLNRAHLQAQKTAPYSAESTPATAAPRSPTSVNIEHAEATESAIVEEDAEGEVAAEDEVGAVDDEAPEGPSDHAAANETDVVSPVDQTDQGQTLSPPSMVQGTLPYARNGDTFLFRAIILLTGVHVAVETLQPLFRDDTTAENADNLNAYVIRPRDAKMRYLAERLYHELDLPVTHPTDPSSTDAAPADSPPAKTRLGTHGPQPPAGVLDQYEELRETILMSCGKAAKTAHFHAEGILIGIHHLVQEEWLGETCSAAEDCVHEDCRCAIKWAVKDEDVELDFLEAVKNMTHIAVSSRAACFACKQEADHFGWNCGGASGRIFPVNFIGMKEDFLLSLMENMKTEAQSLVRKYWQSGRDRSGSSASQASTGSSRTSDGSTMSMVGGLFASFQRPVQSAGGAATNSS
ncbi:hypothetical protein CALVIDRAFT_602245 [Calocera viscosa TUFC12733]|uniref:Uncharacterized protein n=1 Tax=Calocera viscosa (strain TUFC12733) TaxID=1330018 RepID=A0A167HAX1_CALVF|nr:hypothetical protein CALVIDRAFT_602245 [Calocera viscosa TUFC12733]